MHHIMNRYFHAVLPVRSSLRFPGTGARSKHVAQIVFAGLLGCTGAGTAQTLVVESLPELGTDISVGADGTAWLVGYDPLDKTRDLYRWTGSAWDRMDGDGFRIAVDPRGNPWVLDGDGDVKYWDGVRWIDQPGRGTDIAVGANGDIWMVGWYNDLLDTDRDPENRDIFHWTGTNWEEIDGGAVRIAVAPDGHPGF